MNIRWLVYLLVVLGVLGGLKFDLDLSPAVALDGEEKIENGFTEKLITQGRADYIVRFYEQPDLSKASTMEWIERGDYVYRLLKDTAKKPGACKGHAG